MKTFIVEHTSDKGATIQSDIVDAEDYTKAYIEASLKVPKNAEIIMIRDKRYPKYIKTYDGKYIGTFARLDYGEFPVYRFEGGERYADRWELEHGSDNREDLIK